MVASASIKETSKKIYSAIYLYIFFFKEMNAISKGQVFQIRKKLLKFRCHQSPGKFICEETSKFPVNS